MSGHWEQVGAFMDLCTFHLGMYQKRSTNQCSSVLEFTFMLAITRRNLMILRCNWVQLQSFCKGHCDSPGAFQRVSVASAGHP